MEATPASEAGVEDMFFQDALDDTVQPAEDQNGTPESSVSEHSAHSTLDTRLISVNTSTVSEAHASARVRTSSTSKSRGKSQSRGAQHKPKNKPSSHNVQESGDKTLKPETRKHTTKTPKKQTARQCKEAVLSIKDLHDETSELDGNETPDAKRQLLLQRNRIAATKCRKRKRSETSSLEARLMQLEDQNRELRALAGKLHQEISRHKDLMFEHRACDCTLIRRYLLHDADGFLTKLMANDEHTPGTTPAFLGVTRTSSVLTPGCQGSSSTSTAAESMQTLSPMTGQPWEGMATPWLNGNAGVNNTMPPQALEGYIQAPAAMVPYGPAPAEVLLPIFEPQVVAESHEAAYGQPPLNNNLMWTGNCQME